MKARATQTAFVEVDISKTEISDLIRKGEYAENGTMFHALQCNWCASLGFTADSHIDKDGYWIEEWEDYGGSHSWTNREKQRKATEEEVEIWETFQKMRKMLKSFL